MSQPITVRYPQLVEAFEFITTNINSAPQKKREKKKPALLPPKNNNQKTPTFSSTLSASGSLSTSSIQSTSRRLAKISGAPTFSSLSVAGEGGCKAFIVVYAGAVAPVISNVASKTPISIVNHQILIPTGLVMTFTVTWTPRSLAVSEE